MVQHGHVGHRPFQNVVRGLTLLAPGGDDSGAQRLGQDQDVSRLGAGVGHLLARLHHADDGQAVLGLGVVHGVTADDHAAGFRGLVVASPQHVAQHVPGQVGREPHHVHRQQRLATHGVDIAEGVGRRDQAELVGVVGDGRKEIHRQDQRGLVIDAVDRGVVPVAHQQVGVADMGKLAQDLDQVLHT